MPDILVADDHADVRESLRLLLKTEGFRVNTVATPSALKVAFETAPPDVVLMDMNYAQDTTSGQEGLELLDHFRATTPLVPVVVMTAWGNIDLAVEAMKRGARDFVAKPWENTRLLAILRTQLELSAALRKSQRLAAENALLRGEGTPELIASSPSMRAVAQFIQRIRSAEASVLISGENGTGKSLVAKIIHALSPRAQQPFITLNAGGLSEGVLESELFGHVRGAFTDAKGDRPGRFELADGGTLFLDEIGNAPFSLQAKLLRVLETGEYERVGSSRTLKADVRVISATNCDLDAEVAAGRFRQDLRYRLNTLEIRIPPLRERTEDILALAEQFLREHARRYRKQLGGFDAAAVRLLEAHRWPGNVRELNHAVERAVLLAAGPQIAPSDLALDPKPAAATLPSDLSLEEMEAHLIRKALAKYQSATVAAEALGLSRSAFYRRMQKHGIGG